MLPGLVGQATCSAALIARVTAWACVGDKPHGGYYCRTRSAARNTRLIRRRIGDSVHRAADVFTAPAKSLAFYAVGPRVHPDRLLVSRNGPQPTISGDAVDHQFGGIPATSCNDAPSIFRREL